ncbi:SIR2 family protein [Streptomyces sp. NPDC004031]
MTDAAAVPGTGPVLDARMALALNVHTCPGVYAVLLGAGISIASGVKTGWGIVQDLVGKVAAVHEPDDPDAGAQAAADPEAWWEARFGEPLGYSRLLAEAAPTPAARQALLAGYFEPADDEDSGKQPTAAHRALARLVKRGSIKVILTTNFDRLMERALEEVGISPHVVREHDVDAMKPLPHSRITVIKLHGDYADLEQRNTVDELDSYPDALQQLLERVVDEYGLLVCGWSAEWDKALVRTVEGTRSRRYPLFWAQVGRMSEPAARLTARHSAAVLDGLTADVLFADLERRIEALDRMTVAPVTRDTAVAQLKRGLPDPVRRIDVHDLVDQTVTRFLDDQTLTKRPVVGGDAVFAENIHGYRADADTMLHLLANGFFHDDGTFDDLWLRVVERLTRLRDGSYSRYEEHLEALRHYPALMATWTMGVAAVLSRREGFLARLLTGPVWKSRSGNGQGQTPDTYLNPLRVISKPSIDKICHPDGNTFLYPQSHFLREQLREPLRLVEPDDSAYAAACYRFEFLTSAIAMDNEVEFYRDPWSGEFMLDSVWGYGDEGLAGEIAREVGPSWPLLRAGGFGGAETRATAALTALIEARNRRPW